MHKHLLQITVLVHSKPLGCAMKHFFFEQGFNIKFCFLYISVEFFFISFTSDTSSLSCLFCFNLALVMNL